MNPPYNANDNDKKLFIDQEINRLNEYEIPQLCGDGITVSIHKEGRTDEQRVLEPLLRVQYKDVDVFVDGRIFYHKSIVEMQGLGSYYISIMPEIKAEIKKVINDAIGR